MKNLLAIAACLISLSISAQDIKPEFLFTGDKAPAFSIQTLDNKIFDTKALKGKTIYLNFFATWCGPCMKELPFVEKEIWQQIKDTNFVMLTIGREHSVEELETFRKDKAYTMPMAADTQRKAYSLFAHQYIPRNIVISKTGEILLNEHGFDQAKFSQMIDLIKKDLK